VGGVLTVAVLPKLVHSRQQRSAALSPAASFAQSN
jgi:hypothetical protein